MKLPMQVFVSGSGRPEPSKLKQIRNTEDFGWKPSGGLWTSSLEGTSSDWIEWLDSNSYLPGQEGHDPRWGVEAYLLEPRDVRVLVIRNPDDLIRVAGSYPRELPPPLATMPTFAGILDWEAIGETYDAAWFPSPYAHRLSFEPGSIFFNVLDVESTIWFRWAFEGEPRLLPRMTAERVDR